MSKLKTIIRVLIFGIVGIIIFFLVSPIFIPKTINEERGFYRAIIQGFYTEPDNSLDVIFLGDSSVYRGISPIKMWEEYGFTSYNFASPSQRMWDNYYCLEEVLKYQKPKVIVLNIDQAFTEKEMGKSRKRHLFDNLPNSINRVRIILDPAQKNKKKETLTLLFPLFRFHSRWSELNEDDFLYANTKYHYPFKGYQITTGAKKYKGDTEYMKKENKKSKMGPKALKYLDKIKTTCQENDVKLLLIEAPAPKTWNKTKNQEVSKWAEKNEVPFLDLNSHMEEIGIDWEKDTKDEGYHMNIYGAEKISMYMGKYLKDEYKLPDHRNDNEYKQWEKDAEEYENQKKSILNKEINK